MPPHPPPAVAVEPAEAELTGPRCTSPSATGLTIAGASAGNLPLSCRKRKCPVADAQDPESFSRASILSGGGDDERGHTFDGRGPAEGVFLNTLKASDGASGSGQDCHVPDGVDSSALPAAHENPISKAQLAERAAAMFIIGTNWPTEVRRPLLAPVVTKLVVKHGCVEILEGQLATMEKLLACYRSST
jgi:hypothetical protein